MSSPTWSAANRQMCMIDSSRQLRAERGSHRLVESRQEKMYLVGSNTLCAVRVKCFGCDLPTYCMRGLQTQSISNARDMEKPLTQLSNMPKHTHLKQQFFQIFLPKCKHRLNSIKVHMHSFVVVFFFLKRHL